MKAPLREKLRRWWGEYQWLVIGVLWLVALVLGYIGFRIYFITVGLPTTFWNNFYLTIQLFVFQSGAVVGPVNWALQVARFLAPLVALFTAIQAFAAIFYEQVQRAGLKLSRGHVVICGLGVKGLVFTREFHRLGYRVVVIEGNGENSLLAQCKEEGVIVLIGDATDIEMLRRARVNKASYLVSVCGSDSANAAVAVNAGSLVSTRKGRPLTCLTQIVDLDLFDLLRKQDMYISRAGAFRLEFFNVFESGARAMLNEFPVSGVFSGEPPANPHALIVGLGALGRSLVVHAASGWESNFAETGRRLFISVVDRNAESIAALLAVQHPGIDIACDIRPLQMDVESPDFRQAEFLFDQEGAPHVTSIYICLDGDSHALSAALTLLQKTRDYGIPIIVRTVYDTGLASLVGSGDEYAERGYRDLHAFGLLDRTCTPELLVWGTHEVLARAMHEDYVQAQLEAGESPSTNPSMVPWEDLPDDLRESNFRQADDVAAKLAKIGCRIEMPADSHSASCDFTGDEVERLAKYEHERWCRERMEAGWRYAPPPKDLEKKTNPLLVPWKDLPEEAREGCRKSIRRLPKFLARTGFQVMRVRR